MLRASTTSPFSPLDTPGRPALGNHPLISNTGRSPAPYTHCDRTQPLGRSQPLHSPRAMPSRVLLIAVDNSDVSLGEAGLRAAAPVPDTPCREQPQGLPAGAPVLQVSEEVLEWTINNVFKEGDEVRGAHC